MSDTEHLGWVPIDPVGPCFTFATSYTVVLAICCPQIGTTDSVSTDLHVRDHLFKLSLSANRDRLNAKSPPELTIVSLRLFAQTGKEGLAAQNVSLIISIAPDRATNLSRCSHFQCQQSILQLGSIDSCFIRRQPSNVTWRDCPTKTEERIVGHILR